jgi:hypothetical protein
MSKKIRITAKRTERRDKRIRAVLNEHLYQCLWNELENDDVTLIDIDVRNDTVVERLASELRACGCIVSVYKQEQYDRLDRTFDGILATAMERHIG